MGVEGVEAVNSDVPVSQTVNKQTKIFFINYTIRYEFSNQKQRRIKNPFEHLRLSFCEI